MGGIGHEPEPQILGDSQGVPQRVCKTDVGELGPGRLERQADTGGRSDRGDRGDGPGKPLDRHFVRATRRPIPPTVCTVAAPSLFAISIAIPGHPGS